MIYKAECPEGMSIRRSAWTYTHAVMWVRDGVVVNTNWCASYELAEKQSRRPHFPFWTPEIVPVVRFGFENSREGMVVRE